MYSVNSLCTAQNFKLPGSTWIIRKDFIFKILLQSWAQYNENDFYIYGLISNELFFKLQVYKVNKEKL